MKIFRKAMRILQFSLTMLAAAVLVTILFLEDHPWPESARDYLFELANSETGAVNTVSSIYLGYRVFDTLGETIVLLVAVSGTIGIISAGASVDRGKRALARGFTRSDASGTGIDGQVIDSEGHQAKRRIRTVLLEVVSGKLGPIVLMFGLYVMLFGHLSPGGGFQGGVVTASGIVFLALGGRKGATTVLTQPRMLQLIESGSYLLMISAGFLGIFMGQGFYFNIFSGTALDTVSFIILLNIIIGLKVGAGIGFMCIAMLGRVHD